MAKWVGSKHLCAKIVYCNLYIFFKIACCLLHIESHWFGNKNFLKNLLF